MIRPDQLLVCLTVLLSQIAAQGADAQWSIPRQIDTSSSTFQSGPLIAIGPDRQFAVLCNDSVGILCYSSFDNGHSFHQSTVRESGVGGKNWAGELTRNPDWAAFDDQGTLFVLWRAEIIDNLFTIGTRFGISKSTDGGLTFEEMWNSPQRYGAPIGSLIVRCPAILDDQGFIHFVWDSSASSPPPTFFYTRIHKDNLEPRADNILPGSQSSVGLLVEEDTIHYVYDDEYQQDSSLFFHSWSTDGGISFAPVENVDPRDTGNPVLGVDATGRSVLMYEARGVWPDQDTLVARFQEPDRSWGERFRLGPRPIQRSLHMTLKSNNHRNYLVYGADDPDYGVVYYEFANLEHPALDSNLFAYHWDADIALDQLGGKYIVSVYRNRIHLITKDVVTNLSDPSDTIPGKTRLSQNYPNPFNPSTTIRFSVPRSGEASMRVFNLLGEEVATLFSGHKDAGTHEVEWDAAGSPSGVYFYRLQAGGFTETRKLVLLR